jgi:hypothetical protein
MKKLKILGIRNDGRFNDLILQKNEDILSNLEKLFYESFGIDYCLTYKETWREKKQEIVKRKINLKTLIDKQDNFQNKKVKINIIYGRDKIFVSFYTSPANRKKFINVLKEISTWKKSKKTKKLN